MKAIKEKKKGGRKRLPESELKVQVCFYIESKHVEAVGGMEQARNLLIQILKNHDAQSQH